MMAKLTKLKPSAGSCVANDDRVPTMAKLTKLKPSAGSPTMAKLTKLNQPPHLSSMPPLGRQCHGGQHLLYHGLALLAVGDLDVDGLV
jgi:hypothetical protein